MNQLDKNKKAYIRVCRSIIHRCASKANKSINTFVSFEDLRLPFQDYHCLDLRERGWLILGVDENGKQGVSLAPCYRGLSGVALAETMESFLSLGYGK